MKKHLKIKFVDFNEGATAVKVFLQILQQRYEVELSEEPEWLVFSVFGNEHLKYNNSVKIFFTGENQAPDFNLCDYAIGFEYMDFEDRYMRFPLWALYPLDTDAMEHKHIDANLKDKTDFCSFVVSNPHGNEARGQFMDLLSKYKPVHSGGRWRNNVGGPVPDKLAFQSKHKFSIAFENTAHPGYTTEKIVQSFAAQTVPVYWGDPRIAETFNAEAFINCNDYPDWESVVERIKEIDQDNTLWLKMVQTPALNEPTTTTDLRADLQKFLYHIFDQDWETAKRYSRDYWAVKQLQLRQREAHSYKRSLRGWSEAFYMSHLYPFVRKHASLWNIIQRMKKKANII